MSGKVRLTPEELQRAHDGMCSVSIGDGPCSCLVHWVDALQKEVDELKLQRRGFQIMSRKIVDVAGQVLWRSAIQDGDYERVGGDAECQDCRLPYLEHPQIPGLPTFHLTCGGKVVKT